MANGRSAQQRMTEAHLPLVVYAVKKSATDTLPLLDIIQEGNLILMKFVATFHYAAGVSFRSRLMLCLRGAETAARQKARSVRISGPMSTCIMKLGRVSRCLWQARGHNPSQEEIAHEMNFTVGMTQQIAEAAELNKTPTSLDVPIGEDAAVCLGDCIADENCPDPVQLVLRGLMREQVDDVLNSLTPEERAVIRLRFGFLDECPRTVQEVSAALHTTNSHVQKVEITAMRKLRHPSRSRRLQGFLK